MSECKLTPLIDVSTTLGASETRQSSDEKRNVLSTFDDEVELHWDQRRHQRTIPLNPSSNIALIRSAPGAKSVLAFTVDISAVENEPLDESELLAVADAIPVSDDEGTDDASVDSDVSTLDFPDCDHPDLPIDMENENRRCVEFQREVSQAVEQGADLT